MEDGPPMKRFKGNDAEAAEPEQDAEPHIDIVEPVGQPEPIGLHMMDLGRYVLLEMMDRCSPSDLCTTAEVCVEFRNLARQRFTAKHRKVSLSSLAPNGNFNLRKVRQLLYNFGDLVTT